MGDRFLVVPVLVKWQFVHRHGGCSGFCRPVFGGLRVSHRTLHLMWTTLLLGTLVVDSSVAGLQPTWGAGDTVGQCLFEVPGGRGEQPLVPWVIAAGRRQVWLCEALHDVGERWE